MDRAPVIHVARELAAVNDPGGVVRFVEGDLAEAEVEGPFDVVIYEDFPTALLDPATTDLLRHVHRELLAPDGRLVPGEARLSLAPARVGPEYALYPLAPEEAAELGLDFGLLRPLLAAGPRRVQLPAELLLGPPSVGEPFALRPAPGPERADLSAVWTAPEEGTLDALLLWFDLRLGDEWVSNAPGPEAGPWGQLMLLVDPPLPVAAGAEVRARVSREEAEDGTPGWWRWRVESGERLRTTHQFASVVLGADELNALRTGSGS